VSEEQEQKSGAFDYEEEVGFGEVQTSTFPKYQGVQGQTDRVAVLSKKLMRSYSYYVDDAKVRFRVDRNPPSWITDKLGQPEQKFALVFFKYATGEDGEILTPDSLKGKVCIWVFSEVKFDQIKAKFQRYPLMNGQENQKDLRITCTDSQWQKLDFDVEDDAHWRKNPKWVEALEAKLEDARKRSDYFLGARKSEDEIRAILGVASGSSPATAADADVDLADVLAD
jgi:hypothetical protein